MRSSACYSSGAAIADSWHGLTFRSAALQRQPNRVTRTTAAHTVVAASPVRHRCVTRWAAPHGVGEDDRDTGLVVLCWVCRYRAGGRLCDPVTAHDSGGDGPG